MSLPTILMEHIGTHSKRAKLSMPEDCAQYVEHYPLSMTPSQYSRIHTNCISLYNIVSWKEERIRRTHPSIRILIKFI